MKTERKKNYNTGFVLTEPELRRIHGLLIEQFQKELPPATNIKGFYEIKYRNGSISEPNTLDEIFTQENIGSLAITRLKIKLTDNNNPSLYEVTVEFTNPDFEEGDKVKPMSYAVIGNNRDWVLIVTSLLDERINRIKRFSLNWNKTFELVLLSVVPFTILPITFFEVYSQKSQHLNNLKTIEENYKNGVFKDPIQALIEIEKFKIAKYEGMRMWPAYLLPLVIPIAIGIIYFSWRYFFPAYNLCWGDYINFKKEREKIGKFLIMGVVFTLFMGVVVNYISAFLGIGK
ncbi:MAG TPA: hypothetical protein VEX17_03960 [Bacillales bacterium]|nr:hypothetical protein [Bacillales bacterium]